jgi:xanthine dehydrogenase molybdenum-binding subunit
LESRYHAVGKSIPRVDALEKVTGQALFTDDLDMRDVLVAKVLHSTIANGRVKKLHIDKAAAVPGVKKIITCFDVPDIVFPTAGHPWSTDPGHQDVSDRKLLDDRVRFYGDDIAVVVAEDELAASRALRLIKVEYEEYPPLLTMEAAMEKGATPIHEAYPDNILKTTTYELGDFKSAIREQGLQYFEGTYHTPFVQHCHLENPIACAYMERGRVVVVSSTQIPHITRRVIGQALGIPWGKVRVIKPYVGGGFGNKQEVLYEPLAAYLTTQLGGKCVKVDTSREETFVCTRVRHPMTLTIRSWVRPDGRFVARELTAWSNQGAYASHGHAIVANSANTFRHLYQDEKATRATAHTVYTNLPTGGAMRGYGIPQIIFAMEAHVEEIARALKIDSCELRRKNMMRQGFVDPYTKITSHTNGLEECIEKGKAFLDWDNKIREYKNQSGPVRKGIGMAMFSYKTGVYPISLETSSCRMVLNQDGSLQLVMGAPEIGQGADTVFCQMAADTVGIPLEDVHIVSMQDTDTAPYDPGCYASRMSYVSGMALKKTGELLKKRILDYAEYMLERPAAGMDICGRDIVDAQSGKALLPLGDLAMEAFYSLDHSVHLTAEATNQCKSNTFSMGVCFAEVEVDIPLGKVEVVRIVNVHDCGRVLNPQLAAMQVHGGMSMSLGYALGEQMLFDEKTGKPLNNNLLGYKLMTALDTPDLSADFVELHDPTGPFGNKSLGEPPALPAAPAVRNAVLQATGVAMDRIPLTPERLIAAFRDAGLLKGVAQNV